MPEPSSEERVLPHIELIARRDREDYDVLADALHRYAWPDGGMDRIDAKARVWLTRFMRWRASGGPEPIPATCGCVIGRCLICN